MGSEKSAQKLSKTECMYLLLVVVQQHVHTMHCPGHLSSANEYKALREAGSSS